MDVQRFPNVKKAPSLLKGKNIFKIFSNSYSIFVQPLAMDKLIVYK